MFQSLLARLRSWWSVDPPEQRIEGDGDVYLDPAYNGRYTAERELKQFAQAAEEHEQDIRDQRE